MLVMTEISGLSTLVESSRPPSPVSTMARSTFCSLNSRKAIAVINSKKVGPIPCSLVSIFCTTGRSASTHFSIFANDRISPFTLTRSPSSIRWGEVNRPTRYPCFRYTESSIVHTDPFPLVPATWMDANADCGFPSSWQNASIRSRPNREPWLRKEYKNSRVLFICLVFPLLLPGTYKGEDQIFLAGALRVAVFLATGFLRTTGFFLAAEDFSGAGCKWLAK